MFRGSTIHSPAYFFGRATALIKLGVAGPIPYAVREAESPHNYSSNNMHNLWREVDGANKAAADNYAASHAEGPARALDANTHNQEHKHILSSAIEQAFRTNEKIGMPNPLAGGRSPVNFAASIPNNAAQHAPLMPNPLKPLGMQGTKIPNLKPPQTPGYNIKAEVQSNANTMHAGNSMMSRENRAAGSPF